MKVAGRRASGSVPDLAPASFITVQRLRADWRRAGSSVAGCIGQAAVCGSAQLGRWNGRSVKSLDYDRRKIFKKRDK